MTNSLYTEALADAKAIREAAEARAKEQLVESMSPKIKLMVEKAILGEDIEEVEEVEEVEEAEEAEDVKEVTYEADSNEVNEDPFAEATYENEEPAPLEADMVDEDEEVVEVEEMDELALENKKIISKLITKKKKKEAIVEKIETLSDAIKRLRPAILLSENNQINKDSSKKLNNVMHSLVKEFKILSTSNILKNDKQLFETYLNLAQEFMSMYKRRRNRLNESIDDIFEGDFIVEEDDAEKMPLSLDDEGLESDDDAGSSDEELETAVRKAVEDLAGALDMEVSPASDSDDADDADEAEEDDAEDEDSVEEAAIYELDEDMEEGMDEDMEEGMEEDDMPEAMDEGEVFLEIDENMLRDEIGKMKAMREGDAAAMDSHFGGGKKGKEPFVDGEDLNKNDHVSSIKESARKVVRHNRQLEKQIKEHKKALRAMKGQLQEMNLFNAKLLYANKLMQNKDLSLKQQKHIVESLDNAKTLGEAKVLFEGLTKSLNKGSSRTGALTEGTSRRVLGTSSRSTRSAQPAKNRVEVDRWALLAGIKG